MQDHNELVIEINENIQLVQNRDPVENTLSSAYDSVIPLDEGHAQSIIIQGRRFDVLDISKLVRMRSLTDGYYRVVYIQINFSTGEYYIGKSNRPTWKQLKRYQGSGLKFKSKFNRHHEEFYRFFIAFCKTAEETESLEASIVTSDLLDDPLCLNLVAGGAGTTKHPSNEERKQKLSKYMKNNPAQYQAMMQGSVEAFQSGETAQLQARNQKIKSTMSSDEYREMSRNRIAQWKSQNPEAYKKSREINREAINSKQTKKKKADAYQAWRQNNPEAYQVNQKKLQESNNTPESKAKRKASLKKFREENPEQHKKNIAIRAKAAKEKLVKEVCMLDLQSEEIIKTFSSGKEAANWLVEKGLAKNSNCASSISAVCLRKPCSTGYGFRKKAYGYGWRFKQDLE